MAVIRTPDFAMRQAPPSSSGTPPRLPSVTSASLGRALAISALVAANAPGAQATTVRLAVRVARHSARGWAHPALDDDVYFSIGSPLQPRIPEVVLFRLPMIYPPAHFGAPTFERTMEQLVEVPTAYTRSKLAGAQP